MMFTTIDNDNDLAQPNYNCALEKGARIIKYFNTGFQLTKFPEEPRGITIFGYVYLLARLNIIICIQLISDWLTSSYLICY